MVRRSERGRERRNRIGRCLLAGLVVVAAQGCKSPARPSQATSFPGDAALIATSQPPPSAGEHAPEVPEPEWRRAVSEQRWQDAAVAFDGAHPHPTEPLLRYVRARIAAELDDHPRVIDLINGLEGQLGAFTEEILRMRARAAMEVGPFAEAARYYEARSDAASKLDAARAWLRAGDTGQAQRALDQAFKNFKKHPLALKAALRATRAELWQALKLGGNARTDYRWIALHAPTTEHGPKAWEALRALEPPEVFTKNDHYARAEAFARAGRLDDTQAALEALARAPGTGIQQSALQRTLAWAYYTSRRDYLKAAELFQNSARMSAAHRASDTFYSARALSRAHRDELAITRYQSLIRAYPSSKYAFQARQLIGRLWYALGKWEQAEKAHTTFIERYKRTPRHRAEVASARYERAIALLAMKDARAVAAVEKVLDATRSEREHAMASHLHALALLYSGKEQAAADGFRAVIASRPLSFAALVSAARLRQMGLEPPGPILDAADDAASSAPPLRIQLPDKVQQLVSLGLDIDAETELSEHGDGFFAQFTPRQTEAKCEVYGQLSTARLRYRAGLSAIRERVVMQAPTAETQWMWDCIYPRPYAQFVAESEARHGLTSGMVHAVMRQESAFHPTVRSPAAAYGLMQVIEPTARRAAADLGVEYSKKSLLTPAFNIELGAYYLGTLLRRFDGHLALAAAGYNAGPGAATRWLETGGDLPLDLFVPRIIYAETRTYVQRVLGNWARYRYLEGGAAAVPELSLDLPTAKELAADAY